MINADMLPSIIISDKRLTSGIMLTWMITVLLIFGEMGVLRSHFFRVGPSESLHFLNVSIDTYFEWGLLVLFCVMDTMMRTLCHDSITIWSINTLCDSKNPELPYPKWVCMMVVLVYYLCVHITGMFRFFIAISQADLVLISSASDLLMKTFTYGNYIKNKRHTPSAKDSGSTTPLVREDDEQDQKC